MGGSAFRTLPPGRDEDHPDRFAFPLALSLTLVALEPARNTLLFAILSPLLLAANVDTARRIGEATRVTRSAGLLINEVVTMLSLTLIVLPWILGLHPSRGDLT